MISPPGNTRSLDKVSNPLTLISRKRNRQSQDIRIKVLHLRGARDGDNIFALVQKPRKSQSAHTNTLGLGNLLHGIDNLQILGEVLG